MAGARLTIVWDERCERRRRAPPSRKAGVTIVRIGGFQIKGRPMRQRSFPERTGEWAVAQQQEERAVGVSAGLGAISIGVVQRRRRSVGLGLVLVAVLVAVAVVRARIAQRGTRGLQINFSGQLMRPQSATRYVHSPLQPSPLPSSPVQSSAVQCGRYSTVQERRPSALLCSALQLARPGSGACDCDCTVPAAIRRVSRHNHDGVHLAWGARGRWRAWPVPSPIPSQASSDGAARLPPRPPSTA